jgi:hypothetical protein
MRSHLRAGLLALAALTFPAAARAELYGGVEVGARGVKAVVVDLARGGDGYAQTVKMTDTVNTALTADLAKNGRFNADALRDTVKAVEGLHGRIRSEFKVPPERIWVAGSSGLFSAIRDKEDLVKENRAALAEAVEKAVGGKMGFVSDEREAELSIVGVVPRAQAAEAVLLDIGSGNTKGGYRGADGKFVTLSVPFGTVSFGDRVKTAAAKSGLEIVRQAAASRDLEMTPALRQALVGKEGVAARRRVYLSGGAVWAMAAFTHPGDASAYLEVTPKDIDAFEAAVRGDPKGVPSPDLSGVKDEETRKRAEAEWERVKKATSAERLLAGAEVLKALADAVELGAKDKKLYFARDAYLGWLLPYIAEQAGFVKN